MAQKNSGKKQPKKIQAPNLPRKIWPKSKTIDISPDALARPGTRVAYSSRFDAESEGFRVGLIRLMTTIMAKEGCHFPVIAGGIISKEWIKQEIKRRVAEHNVPRKFLSLITQNVREYLLDGLESAIPLLRKPDGTLVKWYVMPSLPHDGPDAEDLLRTLQEQRPDIRQYKRGGERIEIPQGNGNPSIYHGVVLPKRARMPSKYMSAGPEHDIIDVEKETSREFPNRWIHGTSGTALYKPSGERKVPYITLPVLRKLEAEEKRVAENQVGFTIVEDMPDGDTLIHFWNLRDLITREKEFITKIKDGASDFHRKIVEIIKREGTRSTGRLADDLNTDRETITREIQFLVKSKGSLHGNWPGLKYDAKSDRYSFHQGWIQRKLTYELPLDDEWQEDSFLFFGCLHAGYTTTDYEYVVKKFPEHILKYGIQTLVGIGDFIAGLQHGFMHKGEVLYMNNTEQEQFAAEIIATIMYRVFTARFEAGLLLLKSTPSDREICNLIDSSLLCFLGIKGNHDTWQERDGNTALAEFFGQLNSILITRLQMFLASHGFAGVVAEPYIRQRIHLLPVHRPVYQLPSGIKVGLIHPHMGRAQTSSLRAEHTMDLFVHQWECQVLGIANFHTSIFAHSWSPHVGQSVAVQTGTQVIFTDFEHHKIKAIDFGPQMLKVRSHKGRIYKTTLAAFSEPILQDPIPKDTNGLWLKRKLGLLGYEDMTE